MTKKLMIGLLGILIVLAIIGVSMQALLFTLLLGASIVILLLRNRVDRDQEMYKSKHPLRQSYQKYEGL